MKRILLLSFTAAAVWLPSAHAAVPCRDKIYNEWYASGKISTTYPTSCYRDALAHIPADAQVYSSLGSDIKRALQAALERKVDPSRVPAQVGSGHALPVVSQTKGAVKTKNDPSQKQRTIAFGNTSATSSNGGLPTIVLVLGGIALALAAAGLIGTSVRYVRRRG